MSAEEAKVVFDDFDEDGSGAISIEELRKAFLKMGQDPSEEEL
jgi:Ca2+-binding EF-hand superfamily protein